MRRLIHPAFLSAGVLLAPGAGSAQVQIDQHALTQRLLRGDKHQRWEVLDIVRHIRPEVRNGELRAALIVELDRVNAIQRDVWRRADVSFADYDDPQHYLAVIREVARLEDPQAIRALAEAAGTGGTVIRALAGFGQAAASAVLDVVMSDAKYYTVEGGLITLRIMVERMQIKPLSSATLERIRRAAKQRLTGAQYFTVLWSAIDLAAVLDDRELRGLVEAIAGDPNQAIARGVTTSDLIEMTRRRAADRLAGVPPLPRWSDLRPPGGPPD